MDEMFMRSLPPHNNQNSSGLWPSLFLLTPDFCDCSHHGSCQPTSFNSTSFVCSCEEGWTGYSDFIDARFASCHLNMVAVQMLYSLLLGFSFFIFLLLLPHLISLWRSHRARYSFSKQRSISYCWWKNQSLVSVVLVFLVVYPAVITLAVEKLVSFCFAKIGMDVVVTVAFCAAHVGLSLCATLFQSTKIPRLLSSFSDSFEDYSGFLSCFRKRLCVLGVFSSLAVVYVVLPFQHHVWLSRVSVALLYGHFALSHFLFAMYAYRTKWFLYHTLSHGALAMMKHPESSQTKREMLLRVRNAVFAHQNKWQHVNATCSVVWTVLLCVPPTWLLVEYLIPLSLCIPIFLLRWSIMGALEVPIPVTSKRRSTAVVTIERLDSAEPESPKHNNNLVQDVDDPMFFATGQDWKALQFFRSLGSSLRSSPLARQESPSRRPFSFESKRPLCPDSTQQLRVSTSEFKLSPSTVPS